MRRPGEIEIYYTLIGSHFLQNQTAETTEGQPGERDVLRADWGAFDELRWSFKGLPLQLNYLTRHYFSRFIQESTK